MVDVDKIIERMMVAAGVSDQKKLIEKAGFSSGLPSKWKKRGNVGPDAIVEVCRKFDINIQWLVDGRGPMMWSEQASSLTAVHEKPPDCCDMKKRLNDAWAIASDDAKDSALYILEKSAKQSGTSVTEEEDCGARRLGSK